MEKPKVLLLSCGESVYPHGWLDSYFNEIKSGAVIRHKRRL